MLARDNRKINRTVDKSGGSVADNRNAGRGYALTRAGNRGSGARAGLDRNKFSGSVKQVQQLVLFWYMVCVSIIIGMFLLALKLKEKGSKKQ